MGVTPANDLSATPKPTFRQFSPLFHASRRNPPHQFSGTDFTKAASVVFGLSHLWLGTHRQGLHGLRPETLAKCSGNVDLVAAWTLLAAGRQSASAVTHARSTDARRTKFLYSQTVPDDATTGVPTALRRRDRIDSPGITGFASD
jgi:hypothetical protein